MPLPTEKSRPDISLSNYTTLLYGAPKRGKSTFAAGFPDALFLDCEQGLRALEVYRASIGSWQQLLETAREIRSGEHQFKTIVIDTVDVAFGYCTKHVLKELNISHESDAEFGKGWAMVSAEFMRVLRGLAQLPYGLVLISHAKEVEIKTRTGKSKKVVTTLPERIAKQVTGMADLFLYVDIDAEDTDRGVVERSVVRTKPTSYYDAGDRTGLLPETLPLTFEAFKRAFDEAAAKKNAGAGASQAPTPTSAVRGNVGASAGQQRPAAQPTPAAPAA